MAVKTYSLKKDGNTKLSPHFKVKEFACKDGTDTVLVEIGLVTVLEQVFRHFDCLKINITSGYRTPAHDKAVGGKGRGNHCQGKAADFVAFYKNGSKIPSAKIALYLEDIGVYGIGYRCGGGTYATHVDVNYRSSGSKWFGDEKISMSRAIWNIKSGCRSFYDYLGTEMNIKYCIISNGLNARKGAGTNYPSVKIYPKAATIIVVDKNDDCTWGKTTDGLWICIKPAYVEVRC